MTRFIWPLARIIDSKIRSRTTSFRLISDETISIMDREVLPCRAAIYHQRDLQKITGFAPQFRDVAQAVGEIQRRERLTAPLEMYKIKNCFVFGGYLFTDKGKVNLLEEQNRTKSVRASVDDEFQQCSLSWLPNADAFYGTWMREIPILNHLANTYAPAISPIRKKYHHQEYYENILSMSYKSIESAFFKELIAFNVTHNSFTYSIASEVRKLMADLFPPNKLRRVYIRRRFSGNTRILVNEKSVEDALKAMGFSIIDPTEMSARQIATQLSGASIVVGVEGSQMAHAIYLINEAGYFINIQPPNQFNSEYKTYADWIGYRYGFVVGNATGVGMFEVDINDLLNVIEQSDKLSELT